MKRLITYIALVSTLWNVGNKASATEIPRILKATKFSQSVLRNRIILQYTTLHEIFEFYLLFKVGYVRAWPQQ